MEIKNNIKIMPVLLCLLSLLLRACAAANFDFFYFVQQWPGAYCDTKQSCCYPTTGKPAPDFKIHALSPTYNNGSVLKNCDANNPYDESKISDLISGMQKDWPTLACPSNSGSTYWTHEWERHGTCAESVMDQHEYFSAVLKLKSKVNLLQILQSAGIKPDGRFYGLSAIKSAIKSGTGYTPHVECNTDASGISQLYQVYLCVDASGSDLIECPVFPKTQKCCSGVEFQKF